MKHIFIILGVMLYLFNTTAIAAVDQNKTERIKKIEERLSKLSETKLKALMERVGKPVPKGFLSCLCGPGRVAGGGCKHVPGKACWCGGPLGGGGYVDFVKNNYNGCIKSSKYDDNTTIVDAIVGALDKIHCPHVPEKLELKSLLVGLFEKSCLPVPENINNLNPHEMIWFEDILNKNFISNITQTYELTNIYEEIIKSDNICEASTEAKLSIEATKGRGILGTAGSLVWIVKGKDKFDIFRGITSKTSQVEDSVYLSKLGKKATTLVNIFDYYDKYNNIASTYNDYIDTSQKNADIKDALSLYKKSKSWSLEKVNNSISDFEKIQKEIFSRIIKIESNRNEELKKHVLTEDEEFTCHKARYDEVAAIKCKDINFKYKSNKVSINWEADKEIERLLIKSNSTLIKSQVLKQYRKPLIEKSCNEYIDDRLKNCPSNTSLCQPLNHSSINKLWEDAKEKIRDFIKKREVEDKEFFERRSIERGLSIK